MDPHDLIIDFYVDFIEVKDFVYSAVGADSRKQTPLHTAAREEEVQGNWLLWEGGANLYLKDHEGNHPIDLAARRDKKDSTDTKREQNCELSSVSL